MEMTMYDVGRIAYSINKNIMLPNLQMIAGYIKRDNIDKVFVSSSNTISVTFETPTTLSIIKELIYTILRTVLFAHVEFITEHCIGYSPTKSEDDTLYFINNYVHMLYTCMQVSETSFNIIFI